MGLDPGTRGGVAVLGHDGAVLYVQGLRPDMPEPDLVGVFRGAVEALRQAQGTACFMEKVGYIRGDGAQGSFTFGRVYGWPRGFLKAWGVAIHDVYPAMWQSRLDCLSGGDKNVTKTRAAQVFPNVRMTHAVADALLIAEYGRRQVLGLRG